MRITKTFGIEHTKAKTFVLIPNIGIIVALKRVFCVRVYFGSIRINIMWAPEILWDEYLEKRRK